MKIAYFPGCKIPFYLKDYGLSVEALMMKLDVELVKLPFNCCGYPARGSNFEVSILSAIKNLAIAQKHGLDILTPCKCCFGQLKHASFWYDEKRELKAAIDRILDRENLFWDGSVQVKHLLSFLYHDIGIEKIRMNVVKHLPEKKVVVQYGCHALRPFSITGFDNPFAPKIFEELVNVTGFKTVEWSKSTECCGNPVYDGNKQLAVKMFRSKIKTASKSGADFICTACTHCQIHYDCMELFSGTGNQKIPSVLFPQILGVAFGIRKEELFNNSKLSFDFI